MKFVNVYWLCSDWTDWEHVIFKNPIKIPYTISEDGKYAEWTCEELDMNNMCPLSEIYTDIDDWLGHDYNVYTRTDDDKLTDKALELKRKFMSWIDTSDEALSKTNEFNMVLEDD
jgi:hypothetical protein